MPPIRPFVNRFCRLPDLSEVISRLEDCNYFEGNSCLSEVDMNYNHSNKMSITFNKEQKFVEIKSLSDAPSKQANIRIELTEGFPITCHIPDVDENIECEVMIFDLIENKTDEYFDKNDPLIHLSIRAVNTDYSYFNVEIKGYDFPTEDIRRLVEGCDNIQIRGRFNEGRGPRNGHTARYDPATNAIEVALAPNPNWEKIYIAMTPDLPVTVLLPGREEPIDDSYMEVSQFFILWPNEDIDPKITLRIDNDEVPWFWMTLEMTF